MMAKYTKLSIMILFPLAIANVFIEKRIKKIGNLHFLQIENSGKPVKIVPRIRI